MNFFVILNNRLLLTMKTNYQHNNHEHLKATLPQKLIDGFLHLIYPTCCFICDTELARYETSICASCYSEMHFTHFENFEESTSLDKLFWGRVELKSTFALLYYDKTNSSKRLLHALKYKHQPEIGIHFGRLIGSRLNAMPFYEKPDLLIPIPIHPKKKFVRGYNQSEELAKGIQQETGIRSLTNVLVRLENSKSQTKLGRFNRWDNVQNKFGVNGKIVDFKHVALVDDVVTTGSTLESIIKIINTEYPEIRISVISLAVTK